MSANSVYVITGGNRGLGLGLVTALLARNSTTVIATVRTSEAAATLKSESKSFTFGSESKLHIALLDFSTASAPSEIITAVEAAVSQDGATLDHVDVLINNAGMSGPLTSAVKTTAEDLRAAFETNAIAPLMVFQALWPLLQKSPTGTPKVIMITSTVGCIGPQEPMPGGAYGPSKAALNWLARALHVQEEASGLVSVALHPGWVQTRLGEFSASQWSYAAGPPHTLDDSVNGMMKVIDEATREKHSGKFVMYTGQDWPW